MGLETVATFKAPAESVPVPESPRPFVYRVDETQNRSVGGLHDVNFKVTAEIKKGDERSSETQESYPPDDIREQYKVGELGRWEHTVAIADHTNITFVWELQLEVEE